ncbi:unnamed protein product [marine sediment metagenome]|uniref:Uncharacterized protein n=1 Tax=marine sediment metagenome TaxID=412755 RepID=X1C5X5_9ZZZZ
MHINRTFSLKLSTVEDLNEKVRPKLRSKFVDRAIQDRLNPQEIDTTVLGTRRLLAILHAREEVSDFLKRAIQLELKVEQ